MARKKMIPIFGSGGVPARGIRSAVGGMALKDGEFQQAFNVRIVGDGVMVRWGIGTLGNTIATNAEVSGWWNGRIFSTLEDRTFVAVTSASDTRIYTSTDLVTWTEVTAGSGKYGNTRFTAAAGAVSFTAVPNPFAATGSSPFQILATKENEEPRLIFGSSAGNCVKIEAVPNQQDAAKQNCLVRVIETSLSLQASVTYTNSSANLVGSDSGSAPNKLAKIAIGTGTTVGDNAKIAGTAIESCAAESFDTQLLIGLKTDYPDFWSKIGLKVGSETLWDPVSPDSYSRPVPVSMDLDGNVVYAFAKKKATSFPYTVTEITLTWTAATNEAPATAQEAYIFLIGKTYASVLRDNCFIAMTNINQANHTESAPAIFSQYETDEIRKWGGPTMNGARLPNNGTFLALYVAPYYNVSTTERDKGVDGIAFYYREPGGTLFRYMRVVSTATYSGGWSYASGSAGSRQQTTAGPTAAFENVPEVFLPDNYHIAMPKLGACQFVNSQLYGGGGAGTTSALYLSEVGNPFRMRPVLAADDPRLPSKIDVGAEQVQAIVQVPATQFGTHDVVIFTDQAPYTVTRTGPNSTLRLSRISNYGTISPGSVAEYKGEIYYLDTDMQIRVLAGGQTRILSRDRVDNTLRGIPGVRRAKVFGCFHQDRYYLAYTPALLAGNGGAMVWDAEADAFTRDTYASGTTFCQGLFRWFDPSAKKFKLVAFMDVSGTVKPYEYEQEDTTTDFGSPSNIAFTLKSRTWVGFQGERWSLGRAMCLMEDSDGTITTTRTYFPSGTTQTGSFSANAASGDVWRYDDAAVFTLSPSTSEGSGAAADITFSASLPGGTMLYQLAVEENGRGQGGDA